MKKERKWKNGDRIRVAHCCRNYRCEDSETILALREDDMLCARAWGDIRDCYNPDHWTLIESPDEPKEIEKIEPHPFFVNGDQIIADKLNEVISAVNLLHKK